MAGNIHFTGTQGVGKTTLLRALLFFYNCRKDRLGIRTQGQQTFDDFYIPTTSSYIVYEVTRGDSEPPFSIILFRHHNRAAFRFVDAPYSKDWFVDEFGVVASDHVTVRQRIQNLGIDFSGIIERYNQYLDILYGNRNGVGAKELMKYYLLRSRQYQNIPRIIQNVFLNERVDAGFIKNTIINSIAGEEEEIAVDLNFFRSKLIHFSDELRDISLWTEKNRHGIVETRQEADNIIGISHDIKASRFALREQCGMLKYAMDKAERDIPVMKNKIDKKENAIRRINDLLQELDSKFDQEKKKISDRIAVLTRDLRKAADLRREYQRIGISDMITRAGKLDALRLELRQKERVLAELMSSHKSITDKYESLRDRIRLDKEFYIQTQRERKNSHIAGYNSRDKERWSRKSKLESEIRDKFNERIEEIDEHLTSCRELLQEQKVQKIQVSASSPMKEEIARCAQSIAETENNIHELAEKKLKVENRLDSKRNGLELVCRQIESNTALEIKGIESEINRLESQRQEEEQTLRRVRGSLCEWLDNNVEGWGNNIGKIVDEKSVLYSQNLSPRKSDDNHDSLFGISLDLESIERKVRTPSAIRDSISALEKQMKSLSDSVIGLRNEKESRISEKEKEVKGEINSLRSEIDSISKSIWLSRKQLKEEALRLGDLKEEEKRRIDDILLTLDKKIQELQLETEDLSRKRKSITDECNGEIRRINKTIKDEEKADKNRHNEELKSIDDDIARYIRDYETKLSQLDKDETAELAQSGADNILLDTVKREIGDIESSIQQIDRERDKIIEYHKDCRDLLDHVAQMQVDKKKLEDEGALLQQKYDQRRQRHELNKEEERQALSSLRLSHDKAVEARQTAEEFIASKNCPSELMEEGARPTGNDCLVIISAIKDLTGEIYRGTDALKEKTNEFRKHFSPNNTFKFPTAFDTVEDYHRYADSLEDFVGNDKIKEFQHVTSNLYRDILSRAASDFNILLSRESEILRIIRDINYDFEKKTFAGVIRRIELRLDRSSMPVITQLQNITDFWNAHQYELGEVNLFSTDEHSDINRESIKYLKSLSAALNNASELKRLPLEETFALKFQIQENDNTTDWVENLRAVGSEGTDILVKAIVNILLISVFKKRAGHDGDFRLHCMMDEIGRLADENIQGILNFANERGIFIVNSSPKAHRPLSYRHLYMLSKDKESNTLVQPILSTREAELK